MTRERWVEVIRIVAVAIITWLYWQERMPRPLLLAGIAAGLYPLARIGITELWTARKIGTEIFVTIATIVALLGGEDVAAAVLMTIILFAEFIADFNTDRARASIKALIGAAPRTAVIRTASGERSAPIAELTPDVVVLARAGERIAVDGTVVAGQAAVDEAVITGESMPIEKGAGASVLAGTVVMTGAIDIRTDKVGGDTMFARIIALVENAESQEAPVQKLADRVAAWLLPAVLVFLVAVFIVTRDVRKIVALMIFTSPAELGLATPMVMIAAIARAARQGILVKGGVHLEQLAKSDVMVFDKTGTLTEGTPRLFRAVATDPALTEDELLRLAASVDRRSAHPLAKAVVDAAAARQLDLPEVEEFENVHGRGVSGRVGSRRVIVGNEAMLDDRGVTRPLDRVAHPGTTVLVAVDGRVAGYLQFGDPIRPAANALLAALKADGVRTIVMLTGDNEEAARAVAEATGVTEVRARLLPEAKVAAIDELRAGGHVVTMVGDGINDAPALARADVGIAMGARGTQAAIEAADIALMTDDLKQILIARRLARRAYRTIMENLIVGVGVVHVLGITAALAGWIGPIQAAMLHVGPDALVFLNSIKLIKVQLEP
ncbi:MAG: cadmium-translocating P-type ATPase [Cyanobacteria bacterium]|nr:cadmium-translocating P-type ATPase [Cyanobacteriota bacterium]